MTLSLKMKLKTETWSMIMMAPILACFLISSYQVKFKSQLKVEIKSFYQDKNKGMKGVANINIISFDLDFGFFFSIKLDKQMKKSGAQI